MLFRSDNNSTASSGNLLAYNWLDQKLNAIAGEIHKNFEDYRISEAVINIYNFVWGDFCSWYLEMIKPTFGGKIDIQTKENTIEIFSKICSLMHPFMPFITEEIWHALKSRNEGDDCIMSQYPQSGDYDKVLLDRIEQAKDIITNIRDIRNKNGIKNKEELDVVIVKSKRAETLIAMDGWAEICIKLAYLSNIGITTDESIGGVGFISGTEKCIVILEKEVDLEKETLEKVAEIEYQKGFVASVQAKLNNERFVSGAPAVVVEKEKAKLADGLERIRILEDELKRLGAL